MSQETRWLTLTESVDLNGQVTREIHVNPLAKIVGVNKYICAYLLLKERRRTKKKSLVSRTIGYNSPNYTNEKLKCYFIIFTNNAFMSNEYIVEIFDYEPLKTRASTGLFVTFHSFKISRRS